MKHKHTRLIYILIILSLFFAACGAPQAPAETEQPTDAPVPTNTPEPSPTPIPAYVADWEGEWFVWVEGDINRIPAVFTVEAEQLIGTVDHENDVRTLMAGFYPEGFTADGSWTSADGSDGSLQLIMSEDKQNFSGNMGGKDMFCGSRSGQKKPKPCWQKIGPDWSGEWIAWLGPDQFEAVLIFDVNGTQASTRIYEVEGTISDDGRTFIGLLNDFGIQDAKVESHILDNMAQFTGNIMGLFPFCGVRRGGPKPQVCLGP